MLSWYKWFWNDDFIWSTVSTKSSSIFTYKINIVELLSFNNFKDDDQLWFWIFIIASKFKFLTLELIQEGFNFKLHYLLLCFNLIEVWRVLKFKITYLEFASLEVSVLFLRNSSLLQLLQSYLLQMREFQQTQGVFEHFLVALVMRSFQSHLLNIKCSASQLIS